MIRTSPTNPGTLQALVAPVDELADGQLLVEGGNDHRDLGSIDVAIGEEKTQLGVGARCLARVGFDLEWSFHGSRRPPLRVPRRRVPPALRGRGRTTNNEGEG